MRYATPAAFRQAIDDSIRARAQNGADPMRLRRQVVFERLLARLARVQPGVWVLKGAVALEARFRDRARTTKDLDLAVAAPIEGAEAVRELLAQAFAEDPYGDWFRFSLGGVQPITPDEAGRPGWRASVRADLDGRQFATITVDIVARTEEIAETETIVLPNSLSFAGLPAVELEAVSRAQHFAEKLHAYTLERGERENTRVKDLTDLVLLIENGLEPAPALRQKVDHVFAARGTHPVPEDIAAPPVAWGASYAAQAVAIELEARTLDEAHARVREFWSASEEEIL